MWIAEPVEEVLAERGHDWTISARSRVVAATTRTSTLDRLLPPDAFRTGAPSRTRRNLVLEAGGRSSRPRRGNRLPRSAISKPGRPFFSVRARERALIVAEQLALDQALGSAAQLNAGRMTLARRERVGFSLAPRPFLPEPESPPRRTVASLGATRSHDATTRGGSGSGRSGRRSAAGPPGRGPSS